MGTWRSWLARLAQLEPSFAGFVVLACACDGGEASSPVDIAAEGEKGGKGRHCVKCHVL